MGKMSEARKEYVKAVDITHKDANDLMKECRKVGVDCITAMYEADSQLAYLNKIKVADLVISEDSDLILFGCTKILFKLNLNGFCLFFDSSKLHLTINVTEEKFLFEKFRRICILSGCDYLDSLHGIGLAKARKFMLLTDETDMAKALTKLPLYLNMKKLEVPEKYIDGFLKAEATFKHMFVYDPTKREMTRLNPLTDDDDIEHCVNAGEMLDPQTSFQLALGNIDPRTEKHVDCFDPEKVKPVSTHRSIWSRGSKSLFSSKISAASPTKHKQLIEVQNIIEQENDVTTDNNPEDLMNLYIGTPSTKRRNPSDDENEFGTIPLKSPAKNPFPKRHQTDKKIVVNKPSLLKKISVSGAVERFRKADETSRVLSRHFIKPAKPYVPTPEEEEEGRELAEKIKTIAAQRKKQFDRFYDAMTDSRDEGFSTMESEDASSPETLDSQEEVVNLDDYQCKPKIHKQTFISGIKPKTVEKSKPQTKAGTKGKGATTKQKSQESSTQMRLSAFGFKKQPTMSSN